MKNISLGVDYNYFRSFEHYFWLWEDQGEVISVDGGSTIAYREQIFSILEILSEQGLPPFGALLLAILATNQTPGDDITFVKEKLNNYLLTREKSEHGYTDAMQEATQFLYLLKELPEIFRVGEKRLLLFQALFESCHNILSVKESKQIVELAKKELEIDQINFLAKISQRNTFSVATYHKDFRCIGLLLRKFPTTQKILEAIQNVPGIELDLDDEKKESLSGEKDLIEELIEDDQTFFSASLVKHIWSGLKIPLHHNLPSDRPLGGVSDLTNKGDLDKLLITEYANDDLVFASRLANNEVLYLRREIPPVSDKQERIILIDISLKNWGTPKTIAFAVALAIAHHPKTTVSSRTFLVGNSYVEMKTDTKEDIIESLQKVETALDPSYGMELFLNEYAFLGIPEIFFITIKNVYQSPGVQKIISEKRNLFKYNALIDQEGKIELYLYQRNSRKLLQDMKLPLERIWAEKKANKGDEHDLVRMDSHPYPILFPLQNNIRDVFIGVEKDLYVITTDKNIFTTHNKNLSGHKKGMIRLEAMLPVGTTHLSFGYNQAKQDVLLCFVTNTRSITLINLKTNQVKESAFAQWDSDFSRELFFHYERFILKGFSSYWSIDPDSLEIKHVNCEPAVIAELKTAALKSEESRAANKKEYRAHNITLRNLTQIYINESKHLVVNKHELVLNEQGHIRFKLTELGNRKRVEQAAYNSDRNEFEFNDGSKVYFDRCGILSLVSCLAGKNIFSVCVTNAGPNKLALIKMVKEKTKIGLQDAHDIVNTPNSLIASFDSRREAEELQSELESATEGKFSILEATVTESIYIPLTIDEKIGVATDLDFAGNEFYLDDENPSGLIKTETKKFYNQHIQAFIDNIIRSGTKA